MMEEQEQNDASIDTAADVPAKGADSNPFGNSF